MAQGFDIMAPCFLQTPAARHAPQSAWPVYDREHRVAESVAHSSAVKDTISRR